MSLSVSKNGLSLIKQFEGCKLTAYQDAVKVWTIGYGTTDSDYSITGTHITSGLKITQSQADSWLEKAVNKKYVPLVNKYDSKYHWNQNQLDALVSFCYNVGSIDTLTAKGTRTISEIATKILAYDKAGGKTLTGLTARRKKEAELFKTASTTTTSTTTSSSTKSSNSTNSFKVKIKANVLNIRSAASASASIVGQVKKNEVYTITETSGTWGKLKSGAGWISVSNSYVTRV